MVNQLDRRCVVCKSVISKKDFRCKTCGKGYCKLHVGSNVNYVCPKCNSIHHQKVALKFGERCPTVLHSSCPRCKSPLRLDKHPSGHQFLTCTSTSCSWNSFQFQPMISYQDQNTVVREAMRKGLVNKNGKPCMTRLKKTGGDDFCPSCLVDEIKSMKVASFAVLSEKTKIPQTEIPDLIETLTKDFRLTGVLDVKNKQFSYIDPDFKLRIVDQVKNDGFISINGLANYLGIESEQALKIMYELIRSERMRGTFTMNKERYFSTIHLQRLLVDRAKNEGVIRVDELSKDVDIHKDIISNHLRTLLKTKQIDGYFAGKGSILYTKHHLQELLLEHARTKKRFKLEKTAQKFEITIELVRGVLHELVKKGEIRGIFTQKREYMTDVALKEEIVTIVRTYRTISLRELANKLSITERTVEESLASLIARGDLSGYIDLKTREFKLEVLNHAMQPAAGATTTLASKAAGQDGFPIHKEEFVEVVREYDYIGGQVHFKVAIRNKSRAAIYDIKVVLDYPDAFQIEEEMISVPVIEPDSSRGVDFYLEPTTCGKSHVAATVIYKDFTSKAHTIWVREKEVWIKCPLVVSTMDTLEDVNKVIKTLPSDSRSFLISDIDARLAYHAGFRAISNFDTRCVAAPDKVDGDDFEADAYFATKAKNGGRIVIKLTVSEKSQILEIRVWCAEAGQLTGLLAKIIEYLFQEINIIRKIKAESREKTVDLMAIAQGITVLSDYIMLKWKIGDIANKLEDIYARVIKFIKKDDVIKDMEAWLEKLHVFDENSHIDEDLADALGTDIDRWNDVIQRSVAPA
ncbi:MAG: PCI domain-containing protein [Promethearchaeota archaeon]